MTPTTTYTQSLRKNLDKGDSTEHTHRSALQTLLEACGRDVCPQISPINAD
jgi:hypothetical protein